MQYCPRTERDALKLSGSRFFSKNKALLNLDVDLHCRRSHSAGRPVSFLDAASVCGVLPVRYFFARSHRLPLQSTVLEYRHYPLTKPKIKKGYVP